MIARNKKRVCVFIFTALLFLATHAMSEENEDYSDVAEELSSITWSPGEDLEELNQKHFNGWKSKPPDGAEIERGSKLNIWVLYRGTSQEVEENGTFYRSDKAVPLVQYGNNRGKKTPPEITIKDNVVLIEYSVTYRWRVLICVPRGGEDGGQTCAWVTKSETKTIIQTHSMLPVHPSCVYVSNGVEIVDTGVNQKIPMNDTAFEYNFDLYLRPNSTSPYNGSVFFTKMKNYYYGINEDERHYYCIAEPLEPTEMSTTYNVFLCYGGQSLCSPKASLENMTYYDIFGYAKSTKNTMVVETEVGNGGGWGVIVPVGLVGVLFIWLVRDIVKRRYC